MNCDNNRLDGLALLTPAQMGEADRLTIAGGIPGIDLMERAGAAVAASAKRLLGQQKNVLVLCGPGNNGGDGYVAARLLSDDGFQVTVLALGEAAKLHGDALLAYQSLNLPVKTLSTCSLSERLSETDLVIDALFGAGLDRALEGGVAELVSAVNASEKPVLAVDLPSGINGASGAVMGTAIEASSTITFFRLKPGHLLFPGRTHCGQTELAQIGIEKGVLEAIAPNTIRNAPALWRGNWNAPTLDGHKYDRGHAVVFSGGVTSSGAARLGAMAALRGGAGLVTVASPPSAVMVNATHLTAIMLKAVDGEEGIRSLMKDPRFNACLIGPGYGVGEKTRVQVSTLLEFGRQLVLDADALTSFAERPNSLFELIHQSAGACVLTPHSGEFGRLFPDLTGMDKLSAVREAASRSGAVIVLKGPDTVIAGPDGFAAINDNAPPWLATAGSGDVLAGITCGLLAQGMPAFEAAAMAVWLHGKAGQEAGPGLIAEDLSPALRAVIAELVEKTEGTGNKKLP